VAPILIVDDHPTMRLLLQNILSREGYAVRMAEHGAVALELLEAYPDIKLLITDLDMPVMSGLELLKHLRTCPELSRRAIAKLVVSAHPLTEEALLRYGVDALFAKPLDVARLKRTVRDLLAVAPTL
jgi:CheY-like chemotaxis protein